MMHGEGTDIFKGNRLAPMPCMENWLMMMMTMMMMMMMMMTMMMMMMMMR